MALSMNLMGLELRVTASEEQGLIGVTTFPNGSRVISSGISFQTLQDLQFMMNFSIKSVVVDDFFPEEEIATALQNSTMAYQLATGTADIAIGLLYNVLYRLQYGVPMIAFGSDPFYAHFQQPTNLIEQHNVFQKPFKSDLAIATIMILSAVGILAELSKLTRSWNISLFSVLLRILSGVGWALATISQQGYNNRLNSSESPPRTLINIVICCGMMLSVWLYSFYSAAILSYFTTNIDIIVRFPQLAESGFTVYAISSVNSSLPTHSDDGFKFKHSNVGYNESLELVFKGNHAHLDTTDLFFIAVTQHKKSMEEICEVSKVQIDGGIIKSGFYCSFDFKHRQVFGIGILKIYQSGLTQRYFSNYLKGVVVTCTKVKKKYHDDLGLKELRFLYVYYFWFIVIALILCLMEIIYKKYSHNQINIH